MIKSRRVVLSALGASFALTTTLWPMLAKAGYMELTPGGLITAGTSFEDSRILWAAIIRLCLGVLILLFVIRLLTDAYGLYMTSNADIESKTIDSLWSVGGTIIACIVASVFTPYAIDVLFNIMSGGLNLNFG